MNASILAPTPILEVVNTGKEFKFRLVASNGKATRWAGYTGVAYLNGYCTATEYSLPKHIAMQVITLRDFADNSEIFYRSI